MMLAAIHQTIPNNARHVSTTYLADAAKTHGFKLQIQNRNPRYLAFVSPSETTTKPADNRNLESLGIAHKRQGWQLQCPSKNFYHKAVLQLTGRHTIGKIVHFSGYVPVKASTNEHCIRKYLTSTRDVCVAYNIGRILAWRASRVGIFCIEPENALFLDKSNKLSEFFKGLESEGIKLGEPTWIEGSYNYEGVDYDDESAQEDVQKSNERFRDNREKDQVDVETEFLKSRMRLRYKQLPRPDKISPPKRSSEFVRNN